MSKQLEHRRIKLACTTTSSTTRRTSMFATTTICILARFRGVSAFGVRHPSFAQKFTSVSTSANKGYQLIPTTRKSVIVAGASLSTEVSSASSSSSSSESPVHPYDKENIELGLGSYTPSEFESKIYQWWEASGCFLPDAKPNTNNKSQKKPYVLPMPPPNVTGRLHMGHAIFVALQDILARFHRMRGRPVLWLPGVSVDACLTYFVFHNR
jgi:hypothetical protein